MTFREAAQILDEWYMDFEYEYSKRVAEAVRKAIEACERMAAKEKE